MSYYTGVVNSLTDLRQALINACEDNGWTWDAGNQVLHKDPLFLNIVISGVDLNLTGRTALTTGDMPTAVGIGRLWARGGFPTYEVEFPATYHIFVHTDEVYLVVNYSSDRFQWLAFGRSTIQNLPGTGMFVSGITSARKTVNANLNGPITCYWDTLTDPAFGRYGSSAAGIFLKNDNMTDTTGGQINRLDFLHSDLTGYSSAWDLSTSATAAQVGVDAPGMLLRSQPNSWNSEAVLLPIRYYKRAPSNRISIVGELEHARYCRVDNYEAGQVISLGDDDWMVFPFHRKDNSNSIFGVVGGADNSGTLGWALRYEEPS